MVNNLLKVRFSFVLMIFLFLFTFSYAQEYYADLSFYVENNGEVLISGLTNHPRFVEGITQEFTSKNKEEWILTIQTEELFSTYIYTLALPPGAQVINVNTTDDYRIASEGDRVSLIATGENKKFFIEVKYVLNPIGGDYSVFLLVLIIIVIILLSSGILFKLKLKTKNINLPKYNKNALTQRQLRIVEFMEKNGSVTQAELKIALKYPKSALSRNISALEKKKIIKRERKGMTMLIEFNNE